MTQTEIENRPAFGYNRATEAKKRQAKESGESAMFTLLILADDFTGALDTGVQISKTGARTVVLTDPHAPKRTVAGRQGYGCVTPLPESVR